jgi:hypothetical protein
MFGEAGSIHDGRHGLLRSAQRMWHFIAHRIRLLSAKDPEHLLSSTTAA